jgi:hypothetical protein
MGGKVREILLPRLATRRLIGGMMHAHRQTFNLTPLDLPLALFLLSAVLGVWPAYGGAGFPACPDRGLCQNTLIALVAGFVLYALISRSAKTRRWWRAVAAFIFLPGVLLSLCFVTQYAHFGYPEKIGAIGRLGALIGRIVPPAVVRVPTANSVATSLEGVLSLVAALAWTERRRA